MLNGIKKIFMSEKIQSTENFNFIFGGKNSINARDFSSAINEMILLTNIISLEYDKNSKINLEINANKEGSFDSFLSVIAEHTPLFALFINEHKEQISIARNIVGCVKDIFDIKKHLKGKKAKEIIRKNNGECDIVNENNEILTKSEKNTQIGTQNNEVNKSITNITNIAINCGRNSIKIKTDKDGSTEIKSEEFEYMKTDKIEESEDNQEEKIISQNEIEEIYILLTQTSKKDCLWTFSDGEKQIQCEIKDADFFTKYLSKDIVIGANQKIKMKVEIKTFAKKDNKFRKEYSMIKFIQLIDDIDLFNQ
jgi:hypothetical protein